MASPCTLFVLIALVLACGTTLVIPGCSSTIPKDTLWRNGNHATTVNDWAAAQEWYAQLADREPTSWRAQAALGHAALEAGDLSTARRALEIASALKPQRVDVARDLADTMEQQEAWDDLFAYLRDRAATTSSANDWLRLARAGVDADDPDTAREALRTALAVDAGTTVGPYLRAASIARRLGDDRDAYRALVLAWKIDPGDMDVNAALRDLGVVPGPTMRYPGEG